MQNTNTYGHEPRQRRPYVPPSSGSYSSSGSYNSSSSLNQFKPRAPAQVEPVNLFPTLDSFPTLGATNAKVHPEQNYKQTTGRFDILDEVVEIKPKAHVFSYSSMTAKVSEKPMKKIAEEKTKTVKKSDKIDTKGKKVYLTQQQYLYEGHKYNTDDIVIIDENGHEIYFSDDDNDNNCDNSDNESDEEEDNGAW